MAVFADMSMLRKACSNLPTGNETAAAAAGARQDLLTKPRGSLGRLEELAVWLARWQGVATPTLDKVEVLVFAGSHGIAARGVSAFPAEVTAQAWPDPAAKSRRLSPSPTGATGVSLSTVVPFPRAPVML